MGVDHGCVGVIQDAVSVAAADHRQGAVAAGMLAKLLRLLQDRRRRGPRCRDPGRGRGHHHGRSRGRRHRDGHGGHGQGAGRQRDLRERGGGLAAEPWARPAVRQRHGRGLGRQLHGPVLVLALPGRGRRQPGRGRAVLDQRLGQQHDGRAAHAGRLPQPQPVLGAAAGARAHPHALRQRHGHPGGVPGARAAGRHQLLHREPRARGPARRRARHAVRRLRACKQLTIINPIALPISSFRRAAGAAHCVALRQCAGSAASSLLPLPVIMQHGCRSSFQWPRM
ncbi:hypothetical protein ONE63_002134 [Megalurothrips usitatus]|uniref:Uncharacterized protein n=1 Tax=Megalurothrips usitatus TaxID=439358 RepID=A0AAV7XHT5_9NEOP|nr:hypothetical protein ONE63_002134 [Megalurothrips usitatus]